MIRTSYRCAPAPNLLLTPNMIQDKALGSQSNCCFIKFDIKPPNKIVNALPGQTSVAYKKLPQSFPTAPGNPGNYGLTLIGVYESFGDDIGGFISFPGMNLGDCLFACSLPTFSNCVGVVYRKEAGINNNVKCYLKSKIAEPVQSWTRGLSGYLYAKPEFSSVLRPDFVNSQPLSDDILISDPIRGKTFLSSRWGSAVPNDQQLASSNLQWTFVMQATGDLVLYNKDSAGTYVAKWWTNPLVAEWSLIPYGFYLLQDGNLVILYGASRQVVWSSNSARGASQGPYILKLFNNGRLAVFNKDLQLTYEIKAW